MAKVLEKNVILGGKEYKAGTKESDISGEFKKQAAQFLIDEKKYKAAGKPEEVIDADISARIIELEENLDSETQRADEAEVALSEANSSIAGLTTEVENQTHKADNTDADVRLQESIEKLADAEEKLTEATQRANDIEAQLAETETEVVDLKEALKKAEKPAKK